jgi:hypothetical protein
MGEFRTDLIPCFRQRSLEQRNHKYLERQSKSDDASHYMNGIEESQ